MHSSVIVDEPAPVPVPVLLVNGTKDRIASYEGGSRGWFLRRVFKAGGPMWSAERTAAHLARRNGVLGEPVVGATEQRLSAVQAVAEFFDIAGPGSTMRT
ncbi:hypothetical protein [Aeromicrobium wangtongii]|uniref:hypothetical protein n=1 Tax=Aeromicrobium wangtongii TaxID=2969247 RepID=UPI002017B7AA|nr:hypothetical protein [Aeromicrobium wangtongii]MCL3817679.1 hypothetical protein [Aeromicrobium wangtongii]